MDGIEKMLQDKEKLDAQLEAQQGVVKAKELEVLRTWLVGRLDVDFKAVGGFPWQYLAEDDPGIGPIMLLYKGAVHFEIRGHEPTNEIVVIIQGRQYRNRHGHNVGDFWAMISGVLKVKLEEHEAVVEGSKRKFWKGVDYQSWGIANLGSVGRDYERAKDILRALTDDITEQELAKMQEQLTIAGTKLENLGRRAREKRHDEAVDVERLRRKSARHSTWKEVRKERLKLALFYPFAYYQVFYGTSEDDYITSRYADPIEGDWYDDLNSSGERTKIPMVVKVERIVVDDLAGCDYNSWCRYKTQVGTIYTAPPKERDFERLETAYPDGYEQVQVVIPTGYLLRGDDLAASVNFEPLPLIPGEWHAPWSWLEQQENERQLMSDLDAFAEEMGFFVPESLQEWAGIIKGSPWGKDLEVFLGLCRFPKSEAALPPTMEGWHG